MARPPRVRKALLVALALSIVMHMAWTLWPVDTTTVPEGTVLTATLTEMPPPPVPSVEPAPIPKAAPKPKRPPCDSTAAGRCTHRYTGRDGATH